MYTIIIGYKVAGRQVLVQVQMLLRSDWSPALYASSSSLLLLKSVGQLLPLGVPSFHEVVSDWSDKASYLAVGVTVDGEATDTTVYKAKALTLFPFTDDAWIWAPQCRSFVGSTPRHFALLALTRTGRPM